MSGQSAHRNLVLVRAGQEHRLHGFLGIEPDARNWDLAVSQYDDLGLAEADCVDIEHFHAGGKWDGIHAFFIAYPDLLARYDYVWLPDDDIEVEARQVDELFDYVAAHGFELAQPSLTLDSYYSYPITLHCDAFRHRHTNFVELMMPILSRDFLVSVMPLFEHTRSGRGIDWIWYRYAKKPRESIAIIDEIAVAHRRPLRKHLHGRMRRDGVCPDRERGQILQGTGMKVYYPVVFAGLLKDGRRISSRIAAAYHMFRAYRSRRAEVTATKWRFADCLVLLFMQVFPRIGF